MNSGLARVRQEQARRGRRLLALTGLLCLAALFAVGAGSVPLSAVEVASVVGARLWPSLNWPEWPATHEAIVWNIRMPRVALAILVGASLAMAGAAFQGMFRNPMADPFVIGVSSGAAFGAALALYLGQRIGWPGFGGVPAFAFAGALLAVTVVHRLAKSDGRIPVMTLLLAGIAVAAVLSGLVSFLIFLTDDTVGGVVFWLMGSLNGASWPRVGVLALYFVAGAGVLAGAGRALNALLLGEEPAAALGIDVEAVKRRILIGGTLLTAAAVSVSGIIGFVGLIVPHMIRLVAGPDHRFLLPASVVGGGLFLLAADTLARTIIAPADLPVGILTSLAGGPFFLYLLRRRGRYLRGI